MRRATFAPAAFPAVMVPALLLVAGCAGGGEQALFEKTCSRCHSLDLPLGMSFDRVRWEETVRRMSQHAEGSFGSIDTADQATIVEYLLKRANAK